jgi:hypothetical protein
MTNSSGAPLATEMLPSVVDSPGGAGGSRNVLVVTTVENAAASLRTYVRDGDVIEVVVPVVSQGFLDWLANDEDAFSDAEDVARRTAAELPGETVSVGAGEADLELSIRDALATFPADEIVVVVEDVDLVPTMTDGGSARRRVGGVPVRIVVGGSPV